ncbi:hypothetical protein, partial [Streptomyces sp. NTH33]|uniref:hypothetical protein n=1 Tax=Streptomyces sp. NTH33 TaxID=1735453 RepID=UPI001C645140
MTQPPNQPPQGGFGAPQDQPQQPQDQQPQNQQPQGRGGEAGSSVCALLDLGHVGLHVLDRLLGR